MSSVPVQLVPLGNKIVGRMEQTSNQTNSGLYLPDAAKKKPVMASVLAVGPEVSDVKEGDKIVFVEYTQTDVELGDEQFILISEEDVLAKVRASGE